MNKSWKELFSLFSTILFLFMTSLSAHHALCLAVFSLYSWRFFEFHQLSKNAPACLIFWFSQSYSIHFSDSYCDVLCLVIEKFTENTRFCIVCNYLSKIIPALQSRCTRFRFGPLTMEQIFPRLEYVVTQERCTLNLLFVNAALQVAE